MKKQITELEFIGGQGSLTKDEELALTKYFTEKKSKTRRNTEIKPVSYTHLFYSTRTHLHRQRVKRQDKQRRNKSTND